MRPCFAFSAAAAADQPETLSIYDEIGFWGVQASDFRTSLASVKSKVLNVEINSPGGDVFAGVAIYNMLRASGKEIIVNVMGVAASAASLIAMAGDKIKMPKNTMMMVHNPWSFAMGNADELRDQADVLDKIGASLVGTYMSKTGLSEDEIKAMLATDTWMTADEALAKGFATEVTDEIKVSAKFDMDRADLPENVKMAIGLSTKLNATEPQITEAVETFGDQVVALAKDSGFEAYASAWALKHTKIEDVRASIAVAREVKSLCGAVKMADRADAFIKAGKTLEEVRAALIEAMAANDENTHVDTAPQSSNKPTTTGASQSAVKTAEIWAKRRQM